MEQVKFQGTVICAHCVAAVYQIYDQRRPIRIREDGAGVVLSDRVHPVGILDAIRRGAAVEDPHTLAAFGPAVTTIGGTAVCGWHAYAEMRARP